MTTSTVVCAALLLAAPVLADDYADRTKLAGTWQAESASTGETPSTWTLEEKGDAMHMTRSEGARKLADFECNTDGKECSVADSGKQMKVSMWYSGGKLVELETRGSDVVKRRFGISAQEDKLEVEVMPIVPQGKPEKIVCKRMGGQSAGH